MSRNNWHSNSDFKMIYDDWMVTSGEEITPIILAEELATYMDKKYPKNISDEIDESYNRFYDKALAMQ